MFFKVPSLRNISKTGPYFHDASSTKLDDAIQKMGRHQLGLELSEEQVQNLRAFLNSLTGSLPEDLTRVPAMPDEAAVPKKTGFE